LGEVLQLIAHRANRFGSSEGENSPKKIIEAIDDGYDVEIDVWYDGSIKFGHDKPIYNVDLTWMLLISNKLWCHAKNLQALNFLIENDFNCFYHDKDPCTLTSKNYVWSFPDTEIINKTIIVMPEKFRTKQDISKAYGICTDFPNLVKSNLNIFKLP
jgi:hypothetical protein